VPRRNRLIFYLIALSVFSVLLYLLMQFGTVLNAGRNIVHADDPHSLHEVFGSLAHNLTHPLALLLAQIIAIIAVARLFAWLARLLGQPTVIGEIVAGIVLGPSLIGSMLPQLNEFLFPAASLGNLQVVSQLGLILFMFVVGMELDLRELGQKARNAVVISHSGIMLPFLGGAALAYVLFERFAPAGVQFLSFALFMGIAMSITAFPVLARIVQERGLHRTPVGAAVITCAAADDLTAWCLLAVVIAIVKAGTLISAIPVIVLTVIYMVVMLKLVRPFLRRLGELNASREKLNRPMVALFFMVLILSAYITEVIGIHALYGAFMAGAMMPDNTRFRNIFIEKVEDVALVLLLPLFFVFTGLRTQIGLIDSPELWLTAATIIAVAVAGKSLGASLAARYIGHRWKDSLLIGALMNTRGLMELVVLNIGYDLGVISPELFAMMVIMALVTTFMTGPAISLILWLFRGQERPVAEEIRGPQRFNVLFSFANPRTTRPLLRMASAFTESRPGQECITALHLMPSRELHQANEEEYERESFGPVVAEAKNLGISVTSLFKQSSNIDVDIAELANNGNFDLMVIGMGQSIYEGTLLGRVLGFTARAINPAGLIDRLTGRDNAASEAPLDTRTRTLLARCRIPIGVMIDKGLTGVRHVLIPLMSDDDAALAQYAIRLMDHAGAEVVFALPNRPGLGLTAVVEQVRGIMPERVSSIGLSTISEDLLARHDLIVLSLSGWTKLVNSGGSWLSHAPTTLIIRC
jgi:Kef-type K+ transport system membrane component KefB